MNKLLQLGFLLVFIVSCRLDGTDTGNPGTPDMSSPTTDVQTASEISEIIDASCSLLSQCEGSTLQECKSKVFAQTNVDTELGLNPGDYTTMSSIHSAVLNGGLDPDASAHAQCLQDIDALSCAATEVIDAYDPGLTNPYAGLADMLPLSCESIF